MSTDTVTDVANIRRIRRDTDARAVAMAAYGQLLALLERLDEEQWEARTDCPDWDVADMVRHLVGAAKGYGSVGELLRQQLWAMRHKAAYAGNALDACNDLQVRDHAHLAPPQLVAELRRRSGAAVAGRMRVPRVLRGAHLPVDDAGSSAGMPAELTLGHLMDTVLTRDVWLHSVDVERATGVVVDRSGGLDARIVEDVVAEWAEQHGEPVELTLAGPAGGRFRQRSGGVRLELDALEFCRVLSGRAPAWHDLLEHQIWF